MAEINTCTKFLTNAATKTQLLNISIDMRAHGISKLASRNLAP